MHIGSPLHNEVHAGAIFMAGKTNKSLHLIKRKVLKIKSIIFLKEVLMYD